MRFVHEINNRKIDVLTEKAFYVSCKTLGMLKRLRCNLQEVVFISLVCISLCKSFTDHFLLLKQLD